MGNDQNDKETIENANKVAGKMYDVSYYDSKNQLDKGIAITHEQVSDDYMEGTIDGKIDEVDSNDELKTHDGKNIRRKGFKE
ncbi:YozQ family protein [Virgibacillus ndiopensis]|uniref:YozQ family protein n=1 Tax=Virgibacillus ndiopensis TaxID=2004408 RepID=UPI000C081850|nr:YozQ family protein [Virgibacillus ndiopensis]